MTTPNDNGVDVVVVGGGPAGLNAALNLGRGRRKVLLCDAGALAGGAMNHGLTLELVGAAHSR